MIIPHMLNAHGAGDIHDRDCFKSLIFDSPFATKSKANINAFSALSVIIMYLLSGLWKRKFKKNIAKASALKDGEGFLPYSLAASD